MDSLGVEGYHCNIVLETSSTLLTPGRDVATEMNAGWSDSLDGEGEESMETILEKARMMVAGLTDNKNTTKTKEKKRSSDYDTPGRSEQPSGKKKKGKKEEERLTHEDTYAESQRLLRESQGVAFAAPRPVCKPVSSVLEKIRQRRLQLGCGLTAGASSQDVAHTVVRLKVASSGLAQSSSHMDPTISDDEDVEIKMSCSKLFKTKVEGDDRDDLDILPAAPGAHEHVPTPEGDVAGEYETPGTPEGRAESAWAVLGRGHLRKASCRESDAHNWRTKLLPPLLNSQELLCNSQLSPPNEESQEATPPDHLLDAGISDIMGLDTEVQDKFSPQRLGEKDNDQENKDTSSRHLVLPQVYTTATHVSTLIDDEAEDEDEDLIAEHAEEEEALGDDEDLQDLIASTQYEKAGDGARRTALHRKWLEQQDNDLTEDILERLQTGRSSRGKAQNRIVSCLDDEDDLGDTRELDNSNNDDLIDKLDGDHPLDDDLARETSISSSERERRLEQDTRSLIDLYEDDNRADVEDKDQFVEDEDEHEKSAFRQRVLEESEEQLTFLSPAEDESSREVFSLINKVNVAALKTKPTLGHGENRGFGSSSSSSFPSKPSFLGRSSSSSLLQPPAHRQGGSGSSRSFVFGRDDSSSNSGFPSEDVLESKATRDSGGSASGSHIKKEKTFTSTKVKKEKPPAEGSTRSGPSLFDILRKQASELDKALRKQPTSPVKKWGNIAENFSVFASKTFKPSRRKS